MHIDVALDEGRGPVGRQLLGDQVSVQFLIPHVAHVPGELRFGWGGSTLALGFQEVDFPLLVQSQIKVLSEEESITHIFLDLMNDFIDITLSLLVLKAFCLERK